MTEQDLLENFKQQLDKLQITQAKYKGILSAQEKEGLAHAFQLAVENPALSENLLFELMSGEKI